MTWPQFFKKIKKSSNYLQQRIRSISPVEFFILFVFVVGVIGVVKYFGRGSDQFVRVQIEVKGKDWTENYDSNADHFEAPYWFVNTIQPGLVGYAHDGDVNVRVVDVEAYRNIKVVQMIATLDLQVFENKNTRQFIFKNSPVTVGSPISLAFPEVKINGEIIGVEPEIIEMDRIVEVHAFDLEPWKVATVRVGDTMHELISGEVVGEILEVEVVPSRSQVMYSGLNGRNFLKTDPNLRDMNIKLALKTKSRSGLELFAGDQLVQIGTYLHFATDEYWLPWLEVMNVE